MMPQFLNRDLVDAAASSVDALQPTAMTLGQLATVLQRLADAASARSDRRLALPDVADVLRDMDLGALSFRTVANLVDAVATVGDRDVLAAFTLKQLEELLARID